MYIWYHSIYVCTFYIHSRTTLVLAGIPPWELVAHPQRRGRLGRPPDTIHVLVARKRGESLVCSMIRCKKQTHGKHDMRVVYACNTGELGEFPTRPGRLGASYVAPDLATYIRTHEVEKGQNVADSAPDDIKPTDLHSSCGDMVQSSHPEARPTHTTNTPTNPSRGRRQALLEHAGEAKAIMLAACSNERERREGHGPAAAGRGR